MFKKKKNKREKKKEKKRVEEISQDERKKIREEYVGAKGNALVDHKKIKI